MSTTIGNHPFLPNAFYTTPLEIWADEVQRTSSEAEECVLEKVEHYKALSDMEHEFLVVYAGHPSGSKIVLGADRNAQDSAWALNTLVCIHSSSSPSPSRSPPPSSSSSEKESSHLAYDRVQVSHDGTPAPIFSQNGPCDLLYTITFSPTHSLSTATSTTSSNSEARGPPSLVHLSFVLRMIRILFPRYTLLEHQCYFFARKTCLILMDLFDGEETKFKEGKRAGTWRGVHVSQYSAGRTALKEILPRATSPVVEKAFIQLASPAVLKVLTQLAASPAVQKMLTQFASLEKMLAQFASPALEKMLTQFASLEKILAQFTSPTLEKMLIQFVPLEKMLAQIASPALQEISQMVASSALLEWLSLASSPWLLVPGGLYATYLLVKVLRRLMTSEEDTANQVKLPHFLERQGGEANTSPMSCSDEKIRKHHAIPNLYPGMAFIRACETDSITAE